MRSQLQKLQRSTSTKSERRVAEILKANHIRFQYRRKIGKYEIDFLIGRMALEVDGAVHRQTDAAKDTYLFSEGYVPIHVRSDIVRSKAVAKELINLIRNNNGRTQTSGKVVDRMVRTGQLYQRPDRH